VSLRKRQTTLITKGGANDPRKDKRTKSWGKKKKDAPKRHTWSYLKKRVVEEGEPGG